MNVGIKLANMLLCISASHQNSTKQTCCSQITTNTATHDNEMVSVHKYMIMCHILSCCCPCGVHLLQHSHHRLLQWVL